MGSRDPLAGYTPDWRKRKPLPIGGGDAVSEQDDPLAGYTPDWRSNIAKADSIAAADDEQSELHNVPKKPALRERIAARLSRFTTGPETAQRPQQGVRPGFGAAKTGLPDAPQTVEEGERTWGGEVAAAIGRGFGHIVEGAGGMAQAAANFRSSARMPGNPVAAAKAGAPLEPIQPAQKTFVERGLERVGEKVAGVGESIAGAEVLRPSTSVEEGGAFQPGNVSWWLARGAEQIPQLTMQLGAAALTGGGSAAAQIGAFVAPIAVLESGSAYNENLEKLRAKGVDENEARSRAASSAALTGAGAALLETLPGAVILFNKFPGVSQVFRRAMQSSLLLRGAAAATAEGVTESAQEAWADVLQFAEVRDPAAFAEWQARYVGAGAIGALVGGAAGVTVDGKEVPVAATAGDVEAGTEMPATAPKPEILTADQAAARGVAQELAGDRGEFATNLEAKPKTDPVDLAAVRSGRGVDVVDAGTPGARPASELISEAPPTEPVRPDQAAEAEAYRQAHPVSRETHPHLYLDTREGSGRVFRVPVDDIDVEPDRFQFKLDVDQSGVGRELKSVKKFDQNLAGVIQVWRDPADGRTKVVNGHHRLELAKRTGTDAIDVRYIDAASAEEARTVGAMTNIAEGRGTAIDAAKLFRDQDIGPAELDETGISVRGAVARDGLALKNLPQSLFQDVVAGRLSVARGAVIGGASLDESQQLALTEMLRAKEKSGRRLTNDEVSELVRFVRGSGETAVTQDSLFGEETLQKSNALEKAELSAYLKKRLGQDKRLFGYLTKGGRADRIQETGVGEIQTERAGELADDAAQMQEVYNRLSTLSGPVSNALNAGAAKLAKGENANDVRTDTYAAVRDAIAAELEALRGSATEGVPRSEEASARPAASRPPAGGTTASRGVGFPEVQDDIFGGPPVVTGDAQRTLELDAGSTGALRQAESRARASIERLGPAVRAGKATAAQVSEYRDALALVRRGEAQSAEEVSLRAESVDVDAGGDLFADIVASPEHLEDLPAQARSSWPPDPLMPPPSQPAAGQIARFLSGNLAVPANPVDPISAPEVIEAYSDVLKAAGREVPMRVGLMGVKRALGYLRVREMVIRLKQANDITTGAHEIAHALEKAVYGWPKKGPWVKPRATIAMQKELTALGRALYGNTKPAGGYKREGFAEYIRIWLTESSLHGTPQTAQSAAPVFTQWFETQFLAGLPKVQAAMESARDKTTRWREQGARVRAEKSIADPSIVEKLKEKAEEAKEVDLYQLFVDVAAPLEKLSAAAADKLRGKLPIEEDPFLTTKALRLTHSARTRYMVEEHMIDLAGNPVGPPLKDIRALVKDRRVDFTIYLWARRALRLWSTGRNPGLSLQDAQQIVNELESVPFNRAATMVYEWNDGVLNYAAQASATFREVVDRVRAKDPGDYIPLLREFEALDEEWGRIGKVATKNSPVKRLKGSGRRIKDPFQSMIAKAEQTILAAHKRLVLDQIFALNKIQEFGGFLEEVPPAQRPVAEQTIAELIDRINQKIFDHDPTAPMVQFDPAGPPVSTDLLEQTVTFFAPTEPQGGEDAIVPFYDQGQIRYFVVPRYLYRSLAGLDIYHLPKAVDLLLGAPARLARAGTTGLRASFGLVTNPQRDIQTFYINTRTSASAPRLFAAWLTSLKEAALYRTLGKKSTMLDTFVRLGGEMSQPLGADIPHTKRAARRLFAGQKELILDPRNWYDFYRDLVQFPESAPRTAELRLLAEEIGWKPGTPMSLSQSFHLLIGLKEVSTDFTGAGEIARVVNQMVPFHNAAIKGPHANILAAKRNPQRFAWRGAQLAALTLLLWWRHKDEEWYTQMEYRERFGYWHFPIEWPEPTRIKIPRSFEIGLVFSGIPEALIDSWYRSDPEGVTEWFKAAFAARPPVLPVPVAEGAEQLANKDFFFDRPIVTTAVQGKPAEEQFNEYTTRVAILLGEVFNQSPMRIDHALRSMFGPVGGDVLGLLGLGPSELERGNEMADLPIVGRMFQRGGQLGTQPRSVAKMYDQLEEAQKRQQSDRDPETESQRQLRLQLEDATKAVSALFYVRANTPEPERRARLTQEAARLSELAVDRYAKGVLTRDIFMVARKDAESRKSATRERVESARLARKRDGLPGGKTPAAAERRR